MRLQTLVETKTTKIVPLFKDDTICDTCPGCLANNTFITSDNHNHSYCKECQMRADAVQYLRDFHCLSFKEASRQLGLELNQAPCTILWRRTPALKPAPYVLPDQNWQKQALRFVMDSHYRLMRTPAAKGLLYDLGFTDGTMQQFYLGWYEAVPMMISGDKEKVRWPPVGVVIPTFDVGRERLVKIRVRPVDRDGEHVSVSGTVKMAGVYGDVWGVGGAEGVGGSRKPVVVLRSELDAMLVQQFAGDICCPVALGGCLLPDEECDSVLREARGVLYAVGNKTAFKWWRTRYPGIVEWDMPRGGDDGFWVGVRLRRWVLDGVTGFL